MVALGDGEMEALSSSTRKGYVFYCGVTEVNDLL